MKTLNVYEKGDRVAVKGTIVMVDVDTNGVHKYKVKDDKSGMILCTWYSGDEIASLGDEERS